MKAEFSLHKPFGYCRGGDLQSCLDAEVAEDMHREMECATDAEVVEFVAVLDGFFERRAGADRDRWAALCEMGLPALRVGEPLGIGATLRAATAVAEKLGAFLVPEQACAAIVVAHALDRHRGPAELRDALLDGSRVVSFVDYRPLTVAAEGTVTGPLVVADDDLSDLVAVLTGSALVFLDRAALPEGTERCEVDPTRPTASYELRRMPISAILRLPTAAITRIADELALLTVSELAGGMHAVLTQTVTYVREREQFGRSIGSFQAVKHTLADIYAATEQARAAVLFAADACDHDKSSAAADVAATVRWVVRAAIDTFERALHLHGAMGYSWELDIHLHLRRALTAHRMLATNHQ
ncbi:MAG: acyl-CoA dehydrogenase family protein [Mycobacterium sp.]